MYGLLDRDIKYIIKALEQHDEIEKAIIFGSRAMGNYKKGSDVDIDVYKRQWYTTVKNSFACYTMVSYTW